MQAGKVYFIRLSILGFQKESVIFTFEKLICSIGLVLGFWAQTKNVLTINAKPQVAIFLGKVIMKNTCYRMSVNRTKL